MTAQDRSFLDSINDRTLEQLEFDQVLEYISKYCLSALAKDIIFATRPTDDILFLHKEHSLVQEAKDLIYSDEEPPLENISDIKHCVHKSMIRDAALTAVEALTITDGLRVARTLKSFIKPKAEQFPTLFEEIQGIYENRIIEKHITDAIDDSGEIRDNASKELLRIRQEIHEKSARLRSRLQKILQKVTEDDMTQENFVTLSEGRFVLPIKSEHKRHIPGIIHGISQTGSTTYIEPSEIIEMNNDLSVLKNDELREVYRILKNITEEIGREAPQILETIDIIAHIDAVCAKAKYAIAFGGIKPVISDENYIYLKAIKHPILVHVKGIKQVIPLTIEFNGVQRGHLISGPNAGGKTVALKSIGINIAMALAGIFPLGECITNYRTIFSSIGDRQSIQNDLSTFSSQILQLKNIIDYCSSDSLVLVDEICSGTDPQEGAALASGILDTFIETNLFFIVTTHQSSLKAYALNKENIANASLEFDETAFKPTYKFLSGIPGNSYAFSLAKNVGLSDSVLKRASGYLGDKHKELEDSISMLQKYRAEAVNVRSLAEKERFQFEKSKKDYETRLSELKLKRKEMIDTAKQEALSVLENANSLVENTIKQIKEESKTYTEIKAEFNKEKDKIAKDVKKIENKNKTHKEGVKELFAGDHVSHNESPAVGSVIEADNDTKIALVEFNGYKFKIPYAQLALKQGPKVKKSSAMDYVKFDAINRIDVRGMRADEAIRELDVTINNDVLNNVDFLTIVHGKGTGILKKMIHEYLSHHPSISEFRLGDLVEGGAGVTIVKFKD